MTLGKCISNSQHNAYHPQSWQGESRYSVENREGPQEGVWTPHLLSVTPETFTAPVPFRTLHSRGSSSISIREGKYWGQRLGSLQ